MIGQCLCEGVQFQVDGDTPNFYQCHCSMCRKATGSSANAATFVHESAFSWLQGQALVRSFKKDSGYRADFCSVCGSPVPNQLRGTDKYWIPAGLLDGFDGSVVVVHLHTASKAEWDQIAGEGQHYDEMPSLDELNGQLQRDS